MSSTRWNSELKQLFKETKARYPHQTFEAETLKAYEEDWRQECDRVGFRRFDEGVRLARSYSEFFPMLAKIRKFIPEPRQGNAQFFREMAELRRRKEGGEKFYTLADALIEFSKKVMGGEIKGSDERGQKALESWAKALRTSSKGFAARMLAENPKRSKSDFEAISEMAAKLAS